MATITTDTFLDGGVARTAGEVWTNNGGRLTVRTDTRWHLNAPASMTGTLGSLTISSTLGGGYTLDGRNVRWMPYDTGTGNVPAIGTTITQGGVSGYFLGVWATITSAPTAVGAAMPATGFIKFREVTGGPYAAGALTGIGASATGPDVVGWIEVVHDQAANITVPRLGDFTVEGDWFDLGTTTGSANQLVSVPTNGSATCYTPGVWIAKIAVPLTDDDYEFYPSMYAGLMIAANVGTDARSKFVCMETNGQVRVGHNGTVAVGFVPPAGRKIRIPNVFGRNCLTATRAVNAIPSATFGTRPEFSTTNAGVLVIKKFLTDWNLQFTQPFSAQIQHVGAFETLLLQEVASALDVYDVGIGMSQNVSSIALTLLSCFAGGMVQKVRAFRATTATSNHTVSMTSCVGVTLKEVEAGNLVYARSTSGRAFFITTSSDILIEDCVQFNTAMSLVASAGIEVKNLDHVDRIVGISNASNNLWAIEIQTNCQNCLIDGITFGLEGAIASVGPYNGIVNCAASANIRVRNLGTRAAFLNAGASGSAPGVIYGSGGNNQNVRVQRCYVEPIRTSALALTNSDKNCVYEHVYGDFADTFTVSDLNSKVKNCGGTPTTTGQASVYGTMFWDAFVSATEGRVVLSMNEASVETAALQTIISGTPKFTSAGNLILATVGDEVQWVMDYWCLGSTGTNVTFSTGARWGNHDLYFQIDKGLGYGGTWIAFNQTNIAAETGIDPAIGFKIKFRAVCAIAATTNLLTYVRFSTVTTLVAQSNNLYPLDTAKISLLNLVSGSRVKATKVSTGDLLFNGSETSGSVLFETDFIGAVNIEARKASGSPFYQPWLTQVTTIASETVQATALQTLDE
jgi:hypothetical protein